MRKSYCITGFDCPNCANKSERHLAKDKRIKEAIMDFNNDRLHIDYIDKELSIEEIKAIIKEVEDDEIEIEELNSEKKKYKFFNKENIVILSRILFAVIIILLDLLLLKGENYFWYNFSISLIALLIISYDVYLEVAEHFAKLEDIIDEALLMTLTSIGAFVIGSVTKDTSIFVESMLVMILYQAGEIIEHVATSKSKEAIISTVSLRVEKANLLVGSDIKVVKPQELNVGDIVVVSNGEEVPIDGEIVDGNGYIDTSSLTGEFVPISATNGKDVYAGYIVKEGSIKIRVNKVYKDSAINKVNELIANSGAKKSKADEFVDKFARIYTPLILLVSILVMIIGGAISKNWNEWGILGLKMLVVGCPCAIVISVPLAYFASLGLASKNGLVVKGSNYLDSLVNTKKVITDKTGTLTKGVFKINKINAISGNEEELLDVLKRAEYLSNHPIAKAIINGDSISDFNSNCKDYKEYAGLGVSILYNDKLVLAGNEKLLSKYGIKVDKAQETGSIIYVSYDNKYLGYVSLSDEIRSDAYKMVSLLKKEKIETILLTGDKEDNAKALCNELGISAYHSELMPIDKVNYFEKELNKKYTTCYIGDGINDAASIKEADVGFAMGALGSDIAVSSADVIVMNDNPSSVYDAIKISKIARRTSLFNIFFALFIKIGIEVAAFLTGLFGLGGVIPMWAAVLADTGLTVVLVINSLLILYRKIKH